MSVTKPYKAPNQSKPKREKIVRLFEFPFVRLFVRLFVCSFVRFLFSCSRSIFIFIFIITFFSFSFPKLLSD